MVRMWRTGQKQDLSKNDCFPATDDILRSLLPNDPKAFLEVKMEISEQSAEVLIPNGDEPMQTTSYNDQGWFLLRFQWCSKLNLQTCHKGMKRILWLVSQLILLIRGWMRLIEAAARKLVVSSFYTANLWYINTMIIIVWRVIFCRRTSWEQVKLPNKPLDCSYRSEDGRD